MVEYRQQERLDLAFAALADPTRRAILERLRRGSARVGDLAAPFQISLAGVSKHLKVLERAGLIRRDVRGREHHCHLEVSPLETIRDWADEYRVFWERRLDALEEMLQSRRGDALERDALERDAERGVDDR